jgi:copper chaperone CopZ
MYSLLILLLAATAWGTTTGGSKDFYFAADDSSEPRQAAPKKTKPKKPSAEVVSPEIKLEDMKFLAVGKYRLRLEGILCNACTRQVTHNLKQIYGIKKAKFNYEEGYLFITVAKPKPKPRKGPDGKVVKGKNGKPLMLKPRRWKAPRVSKVLRAVRHAGRKVRLGTEFRVVELKKLK